MAEQRRVLGAEEGRNVLSLDSGRGFTIIELLVAMSILAVLVALGAPGMATYLQNSKLAAATSTLFSAVQTARTEAIRRNVQTQFVLTDTPVSTPDVANVLAPAVGGANWVVRAASGGGGFLPAIEAKSGSEGEASTSAPAIQLTGAASAPAVFDGTITFNGFGQAVNGAFVGIGYSIDIKNPAAGICAADGGTIQCRRITVSPGGQVAACVPAAPVGDSRAC
jgi:type IV fimbrial biogenesis protein FimT